VAERLNRLALSLPCSVGLTASDQARVIELIRGMKAKNQNA
jgi:dTDP-4-amino-4,6-dideoxygalactose transaminase